jgi:hypothetical protein
MWNFINLKINNQSYKYFKIIKLLNFKLLLKRENLYLASLWKGRF